MYVVLGCNTNYEHSVYGSFRSEEKAEAARRDLERRDQLHIYSVMEVLNAEEEEEEGEEEEPDEEESE